MARRSLILGALACFVAGWCSPASAAAPSISSKKTLYCESEKPVGTADCLFPVQQTTWPSWIDEADKAGILELEQTFSAISDIVGGISAVRGYVTAAKTFATTIGLIKAEPSQLDVISKKLDAIDAHIGRLEQLQLKVHESLFQQSVSERLHDAAVRASTSRSGLQLFMSAHFDYPDCLKPNALECAPFWRSPDEHYALQAHDEIDRALTMLDTINVGGLDSVWLDAGIPHAFDPRAAASFYLAMVAQELTVLTWEVGPYGLVPTFRERLHRRAAFINQVLIPNLKEWAHARCKDGPHFPDSSGSPSPLGTRVVRGVTQSFPGGYNGGREYYQTEEWTKTCDYSSDTKTVFGCYAYKVGQASCVAYPFLKPLGGEPFFKGDPTEMATLERIGLSQWSYQAAHLVGVASDATYAGCFSRSGPGTLLPNREAVAPVTASSCIQAARSSGHSFAQLTPDGCYSGNGIGALVRIPDASCDTACADGGEMCGGDADASSVFQVVGSKSALVSSNLVGGKTSYVGCYQPPASTARVLQVDSAEACLNAAVGAKAVYASVEPGGVCRLTNTLRGSAALPEAACSSSCPAGDAQTCGGAGAASVFATNDPMVSQSPPQSLMAVASGPNSVRLTWTDTSDDETGFRIERRPTESLIAVYMPVAYVNANVTAYEDTGLSPSTSYSYRVETARGASFSISSNEASATTWPAGAKAPPWLTPLLNLILE